MGIIAHGIDMVENDRIRALLDRHGQRFLDRVFTPAERDHIARMRHPIPHVAGRFAAKEALLKMIGTGWRGGIAWTDMEIVNDALGAPIVHWAGHAARVAARIGIRRVMLSITHTRSHAVASAIGVDA